MLYFLCFVLADFLSSETEMESVANSTYSDTAPTETEEISTSISPALALAEIVTLLVHAAYAPPTAKSAITAIMRINLVFLIWLHLNMFYRLIPEPSLKIQRIIYHHLISFRYFINSPYRLSRLDPTLPVPNIGSGSAVFRGIRVPKRVIAIDRAIFQVR